MLVLSDAVFAHSDVFFSNKEPVELEAKGETATSHHMHKSQPERRAYFLDTSVASLVVNGDLFHREPEYITHYMWCQISIYTNSSIHTSTQIGQFANGGFLIIPIVY